MRSCVKSPIISTLLSPFVRAGGGTGAAYVDPVPDYLVKFRCDGNDAGVIPVNSPLLIDGLDLPDKKAYNFNGVDQALNANADSDKVNFGSGAWYFALRVRTTASGAIRNILSNGNGASGNNTFALRSSLTGEMQLRIFSSSKTSVAAINDGSWHSVVVQSLGSGSPIIFYIDGALDVSRSGVAGGILDSGNLAIGALGGIYTGPWDGDIDDVRIGDRTLTPTEILALHNNKE